MGFISMLSAVTIIYGRLNMPITENNRPSIRNYVMYTIASLTIQGNHFITLDLSEKELSFYNLKKGVTIRSRITHRFSLRVILTCWLLAIVVLINAYKSVLISYLTIPKLKPIPQSLEELAAMKEYRITIMKNTLLANSIFVLSF